MRINIDIGITWENMHKSNEWGNTQISIWGGFHVIVKEISMEDVLITVTYQYIPAHWSQ